MTEAITIASSMELFSGYWLSIKDGDPRAYTLFQKHYSYRNYRDGRRRIYGYRNRFLICGPGEKLVLLTADSDALFVWRKFISRDSQTGVNCAVFRNESPTLSSLLIHEACAIAWQRRETQFIPTFSLSPQGLTLLRVSALLTGSGRYSSPGAL